MAPKLTPGVMVMLDRERELRLDNAALFHAELALSRLWERKISLIRVMLDPEALGMNDLSVLLWAGCRHEDPDLTLEQVQASMTFPRLASYLEAIYQVWNEAIAPAEPQHEVSNGPFPSGFPGSGTGALPGSSLASVTVSSGA